MNTATNEALEADELKIAIDGEGVKFLIVADVNLLRKTFLVGKLVNFWLLAGILPHPQGFP